MGLFLVLASLLLFPSPILADNIPGCSATTHTPYNGTFVATDFVMENSDISNGRIVLNTGAQVIDPNRIIIPFTQEVLVTFLYEGAGYVSDFGWMFYDDAVNASGNFLGWGNIPLVKKRLIFSRILDDNETGGCCGGGNGILDSDYAGGGFPTTNEAALAAYNDGSPYKFKVDNDGVVTPKDMKKSIGIISGGKEIVFWLTADKRYTDTNANNVFFTKKNWNPDTYGACLPAGYLAGTTFNKRYQLDVARPESACLTDAGWLAAITLNRLNTFFGITLAGDYLLPIKNGSKFSHAIVGAPPSDPNQWILGMEDLMNGGDADHNDMVFKIERQTGGTATLESANAITVNEDDYFTAVTFEAIDNMPGGACAGKTSIKYSVSIDNGVDVLPVNIPPTPNGDGEWDHQVTLFNRPDWDIVKETDKNGATITNWTFGNPPVTYRSRRIDFAGLGMLGGQLRWKAELSSNNEACVPEIIDVTLSGTVATHGFFSRASPSVQTNMLYSGSYETPARSWPDKKSLRGHLNATRLYDPANPTLSPQTPVAKWDAGAVLTAMSPDARNIYYPSTTMHTVINEEIGRGDAIPIPLNKHFSGTLTRCGTTDPCPISATTVVITDATETFKDSHTDVLTGNFGGFGTINRFTGEFDLTFNNPPGENVPVLASYTYYTMSPVLNAFTTANVDNSMLGLDDTMINATAYKFDLNGDNVFNEADGDWLVNWVRGYKDGVSTKKDWLLGPIDHSVPAVQTPPGVPAWYYGTKVTDKERKDFDKFVKTQWERPTMIYVGSRDGILHAFDGGNFRWGYYDNPDKFIWGDNPKTTSIKEFRGYYKWTGATSDTADYGTGQEKWAFIPANLLSRLKNNAMSGEDQAYVDGSPAISDVYVNGGWKTVLLGAEGNGGDTVYCLDVTNPLSPTFMWEFADPDLFRSQSSPAVAVTGRLSSGQWVAFFVSGKTYLSKFPSIYMIDIANGNLVKRIYLDAEPNGLEGVPSGQPSTVDSDADGYIDRIYIGTNKGYLYKVDLPDNLMTGIINICVINTDFVDNFGNSVAVNQRYHPIYASPAVMVQNTYDSQGMVSEYKTNILFGTGDSPYFNDDINTGDTKYHFFSYVDTAPKGICTPGTVSLDWLFELPAGERIFASAFAAAKTVYFGTSTAETEDPCEGSGIVGRNLGKIRAIDINQTGSVDVKFTKTTGNIVSAPVVDDNHLYVKTTGGGLQTTQGPFNNPAAMAGLVDSAIATWREIFDRNEPLR